MQPPEQPDRIHVAFDDHRLVGNAGLLLPITLVRRLGLGELVVNHVDLGDAPGRANARGKTLPPLIAVRQRWSEPNNRQLQYRPQTRENRTSPSG